MEILEKVICPICTLRDTFPFATCDGLQIVQCASCGFIYVDPRPCRKVHSTYFEKEYIVSEKQIHDEFGSWRDASLRREASVVKKHKPKGGRILDIGCASGHFLSFFASDQNWECHGVELSKFAAEQAKRDHGIEVFCGTLNDANYPESYFDVVTILDTLPLIRDPVRELSESYRVLKRDGILAIEIPGFEYRMIKNKGLLCCLLYGKWISLNPRIHLYYYSDETLKRLLVKVGFRVIRTCVEGPSLYGGKVRQLLYQGYYAWSRIMYRATMGKINVAAKVFYLTRKIA